jgi:hypothetical protein
MDTDGTDENGTTIRAQADDPGGVMIYIPHVSYLDTQAGALQLGLDLGQVPELITALLPFLSRTFTVAGHADLGGKSLLWVDPAAGPDGCIVLHRPDRAAEGQPTGEDRAQDSQPLPEADHSTWSRDERWYWRCMGIRHCHGMWVDGPHANSAAAEAGYHAHAAQDHGAQPTDAQLHRSQLHPQWEYAVTKGPRKQQWDYTTEPPEGDGWVVNVDAGRDGWEREDYHEEAYWKRPKPTDEPSVTVGQQA